MRSFLPMRSRGAPSKRAAAWTNAPSAKVRAVSLEKKTSQMLRLKGMFPLPFNLAASLFAAENKRGQECFPPSPRACPTWPGTPGRDV